MPTESLSASAQAVPTPAFVLDEPALTELVGGFQDALTAHWPNHVLGYSFKTNSLPWLIKFMQRRGAWAEVVSDTEYQLAVALGFDRSQIVYNGPVKGREQLREAIAGGSIINLDAQREVSWVIEYAGEHPDREVKVGLRMNWDFEANCPGELNSSPAPSRFGFNLEDGSLADAIGRLQDAGVRVAGLHSHLSTSTHSTRVYRAAATTAARVVTELGLQLEWLDLGGGYFGGNKPGMPTFDDYVTTMRESVAGVIDPEQTRLIVEPGGALVAVPFEFHSTVVDVKRIGDERILVTDASRTNIDPKHLRSAYAHELLTDVAGTAPLQAVCGFTCMETDVIMKLADAPALEVGDRIVYRRVGAYTMAFQSNFIEYHPEVYVRSDAGLQLVRHRTSVEDFLRGSII